MELNIQTGAEINMVNAALCISEERTDELNKLMDDFCDSLDDVISLAITLKTISSFCNTQEELAYCMFTHGVWCAGNLKLE